jgi:hypothetical protein
MMQIFFDRRRRNDGEERPTTRYDDVDETADHDVHSGGELPGSAVLFASSKSPADPATGKNDKGRIADGGQRSKKKWRFFMVGRREQGGRGGAAQKKNKNEEEVVDSFLSGLHDGRYYNEEQTSRTASMSMSATTTMTTAAPQRRQQKGECRMASRFLLLGATAWRHLAHG